MHYFLTPDKILLFQACYTVWPVQSILFNTALSSAQIVGHEWEDILGTYLTNAKANGLVKPETDIKNLSRQLLMLYQGAVAMWRLSGNNAYIDQMEKSMLLEIDRWCLPTSNS